MLNTAVRASGLVLVVGAALVGIAIVLVSFEPVVNQPFSPGVSLLFLLSSILLLMTLPAMYAKQADSAGWLGLVGHALLQTGVLLLVVLASTPILYPSLNPAPSENIVLFFLAVAFTFGLLLTGIATIRADIFPRWAGILLLAATVGFFFDFFVAEFLPPLVGQIGSAILGILLAIALAGIGLALWVGNPRTEK